PITALSAESDATRSAIAERTKFIRDRYHKRKDGSVFPVEITVNVMSFQGQEILIGAIRDVTESRRSEEALQQANRSLALLTHVTRHDINNQLLALNGFLELLHEKVKDPSVEDYFTWISQVSTRISSMIQFASAYESVRKTDPVWQDIRNLAETAVRQVSLGNVMVKNEIPAGAEVFSDPLIVKVIYNLVDNAIRYGGKISTIRFSLSEKNGNEIIVCEDDGVGVLQEYKEKIFDRGFGKNTGLGLFLAREILSLTGITIRETGEPGAGARFEMAVPTGSFRFTGKQ
ncbi:MAG: ATP-binding protein, partial [Methanoregula sp.]